jgi:hypothetical protein
MAVNLVSIVTQFLSPDLVARIASALGLDLSAAQKAIGGSVPAILAGLVGVASKPEGARQLSSVLAQQSPNILDNLTSVIGGSAQKTFAESGSNLLSTLLGGGATNALATSISKFAGISGSASSSLVGMLGPVVLGVLGKEQRSSGLDAGGLASLLQSQKDQIAAAIPSGLADRLGGSGLLSALDSGLRRGAAASAAAMSGVAGASQATYAMGSDASSRASKATAGTWPIWVLGLAVLAGLGWYLLSRESGDKVAEQVQPPAAQPAPPLRTTATQLPEQPGGTVGLAPAILTAGGVNLASQVNVSVGALRTALAGITDVGSAEAALPRIRDAKAQLDRVSALAEQLPPDGKRALAGLVASVIPAINTLCDRALALPGVSSVAKPAIDELRVRLDSLSHA